MPMRRRVDVVRARWPDTPDASRRVRDASPTRSIRLLDASGTRPGRVGDNVRQARPVSARQSSCTCEAARSVATVVRHQMLTPRSVAHGTREAKIEAASSHTGALGTGALITLIILSVQRNEVAFVALGDWGCGESNCKVPPSAPLGYQNGAENTRMVAAAMSASATAIGSQFVLALGDNFYFRGVKSVDDPLFAEVWEKQFVAPSLTTPWYVILGNHDHYGNPEAQIDFSRQARDCQDFKHCPNRWTLPRYWYSKQIKTKSFSVNFVFIDTVILCQGASEALAAEKARMGALNGADLERWNSWADQRRMMAKLQMEWLQATLNASTAEWIIVAGHYPVYSGGEHGNTAELQHLVEPLLQHFRVDAYLCGHDHTLQHLKSRGVNYFVSGVSVSVCVCERRGWL
jgi:tartrate-resistant acid phosphatase type 5